MLTIAADHAGFRTKEKLKALLREKKVQVTDLGAFEFDKDDDYPDFAKKLAKEVAKKKGNKGILLCGSGQGVCIAANKVQGIRAALCWNEQSAKASRADDDANVLCLGARLLSFKMIEHVVDVWLKTPYSGLARHKRRIKKIETGKPAI